ncbi:hypothetical protein CXX78_02010 [Candidatus Parvarchaeota archaeon]|nr:MAG: hypothetical protein CXX78_02010 [Candidatus Parvarchaeota archaeon]
MEEKEFKRHIAYKLKIGEILEGTPSLEEEKLKFVEILGNKVSRINLIANITDKFIQEGEKKFGSITLDDASGQIKAKVFGDEINNFSNLEQGDTLMLIGLLRHWNNEIYLTPEVIRKKEPIFLLIRKTELEFMKKDPKTSEEINEIKEKIIEIVKREEPNNGSEISSIISELKSPAETINNEVKKLLEDGTIYEPRPGKIRYLG